MLTKLRILNKKAFNELESYEEAVIWTIIGLPRNEEAPRLMHKAIAAPVGRLDEAVLALYIEGSHCIDFSSAEEDFEMRIIVHRADGVLLGDIISHDDIFELYKSGLKSVGLPEPPPRKKHTAKILTFPSKGGLKS